MEHDFNAKPNFTDMLIECKDCGRTFVVTSNEQSFFFEKHLAIPKRCPQCRQIRREQNIRGLL
jgi:DNA replicative helicase MCM subunit Mcm2 (Cdc46/Mcm family)